MSETLPTVLLPEADDPTIAALKADLENGHTDQEDLGANVRFEEMSLSEAAAKLNEGEVDIVIAGQKHGSPEVLRTAIREVGAPEKFITSFFIMEKEGEEPLFFADCAVHDKPKPHELVKIAEQTCTSVAQLGYEPVVAFLSLSSFGSAEHLGGVMEIQKAAHDFKEKHPDIISYGEIQLDAATDPEVFKKKADGKEIELVDGKLPNVFIFPDGQSGNITYKALERLGGWTAVGPMLDGVTRDIHDLSRGGSQESLRRSITVASQLYRARHYVNEQQTNVHEGAPEAV